MRRFITVLTCLALVAAACGQSRTSEDVLAADAPVAGAPASADAADGSGDDAEDAGGTDGNDGAEGTDSTDGTAPTTPTTLAPPPPTTAPDGDIALTADFGDATVEITHGEMNELVRSTTDSDEFVALAFGGVRPPDLETVVLTQQLASAALQLEMAEVGAEVSDPDLEASEERMLNQLTNLYPGAADPLVEAGRLYEEVAYLQFLAQYQASQDVLTVAVVDEAAPGEGNPCVSHVLVATDAEAQEVLERLEGGEDFADLATELSTDQGSAAAGGALGCAPSSNYVGPFAAAVDEAELGEYVGPVETDFGFHVLVVDRYEVDGVEEASGRLRERLSGADITVDERLGTWDPSQFAVLPVNR